ncbi:hypothetical protein ACN94_05370 [Gordonia paraffinivorans]|nr:hypothetical protein [Gordonia paraffinivorans]PWD42043.1 hypothetical protein ACN93_15625 [Gordonia paraffinivorans]
MTDTAASIVEPGAPSPIASLPNLRDLGGWAGADGARVRSGLLYRTADFRELTDDDAAKFAGLGVKTVYDLRSAAERSELPDPTFPGVTVVALDVLADAATAIPANLGAALSNPHIGGRRPVRRHRGRRAAHHRRRGRQRLVEPHHVGRRHGDRRCAGHRGRRPVPHRRRRAAARVLASWNSPLGPGMPL